MICTIDPSINEKSQFSLCHIRRRKNWFLFVSNSFVSVLVGRTDRYNLIRSRSIRNSGRSRMRSFRWRNRCGKTRSRSKTQAQSRMRSRMPPAMFRTQQMRGTQGRRTKPCRWRIAMKPQSSWRRWRTAVTDTHNT